MFTATHTHTDTHTHTHTQRRTSNTPVNWNYAPYLLGRVPEKPSPADTWQAINAVAVGDACIHRSTGQPFFIQSRRTSATRPLSTGQSGDRGETDSMRITVWLCVCFCVCVCVCVCLCTCVCVYEKDPEMKCERVFALWVCVFVSEWMRVSSDWPSEYNI